MQSSAKHHCVEAVLYLHYDEYVYFKTPEAVVSLVCSNACKCI
jgi:hypothetical protein